MQKVKKNLGMIVATMMIMLCGFTGTVFAEDGGMDVQSGGVVATIPANTNGLTPEGNLTLVDDVEDGGIEEAQVITMQSKNGNYFYLVIDRANDEENIHFLNLVDEADLLALMDEAPVETVEPIAVCACAEHCEVGAVNTDCPICVVNMKSCEGEIVQEVIVVEDVSTTEESSHTMAFFAVGMIFILLLCGGGFFYMRLVKPKKAKQDMADLDGFEMEEDEEFLFVEEEESEGA